MILFLLSSTSSLAIFRFLLRVYFVVFLISSLIDFDIDLSLFLCKFSSRTIAETLEMRSFEDGSQKLIDFKFSCLIVLEPLLQTSSKLPSKCQPESLFLRKEDWSICPRKVASIFFQIVDQCINSIHYHHLLFTWLLKLFIIWNYHEL